MNYCERHKTIHKYCGEVKPDPAPEPIHVTKMCRICSNKCGGEFPHNIGGLKSKDSITSYGSECGAPYSKRKAVHQICC